MKFSNQPSIVAAAPSPGINPYGFPLGVPSPEQADVNNGIRKLGLLFALGVVYLRYSLFHEVLSYYGGFNTKVLYLFAIPAMFFLVFSNGFRRIFSARSAFYWLAFIAWMGVTVIFSIWRGDSASYVWTYLRTDLPMLFFLAGLPMTWKECRMVFYTIALAGITSVSFSLFFGYSNYYSSGRSGLAFGTMSNPNDYAGILILALPFIVFMVLRPMNVFFPIRILFQLAGLAAGVYGFYLVLASGSRGAVVAILACLVFAFFNSRASVRIALLVVVPLAGVGVISVLPATTLSRLESFSTGAQAIDTEATESARMRQNLLMASIHDTLTHPIFGVGPGQFPNYEGKGKTHQQGGFITSHNSYTEISSETGLPGIFFYAAGIFSAFLLLLRTWKVTEQFPQTKEISTACFCLALSCVGFCVAIFFLNFAYFFYLPGFSGLIISLSAAVKWETSLLSAVPQTPPPPAFTAFTGRRPTPSWAVDQSKPAPPPTRFPLNRYR